MKCNSFIAVTLVSVLASTASVAGVRDPNVMRVMQRRARQ